VIFKGAIFDFNGTLFWDTPYHDQAWDLFLKKYGVEWTNQEKRVKIHGKTNKDILQLLFNRALTIQEIQSYAFEKESIYRNICLGGKMELAPGAIDLFNFLKRKEFPFTLATSSEKENVDFYFDQFKLAKWLEYENVVYDDGTISGKPSPDIFLRACSAMGLNAFDTIIFEDSVAGIQAAQKAKAGKIYIVNSTNTSYDGWPYEIIKDFKMVDRNIFL